jgi:uncharacterized membrane protein YccC
MSSTTKTSTHSHASPTPVPQPLTEQAMLREPKEWLPRLSMLLDQQGRLCEGLNELSEAQSVAVVEGDADLLMRILGERQVLVDRVSEINSELDVFRRVRERALAMLSESQRAGVNGQVERIAKLVDGVCERDERDRAALEKQRQRVSEEIGGLGKARGAVRAYGGAGTGVVAPRFQDRHG